jgi:sulfhydrogenase subunit alpha
MTHDLRRSLRIGGLTRVEGEGGLRVRVKDGRVVDAQLDIYEPPRFFEALLRGRGFEEPVDITARICGICPVAYQMSAVAALEDAAGVVVDGPLRELRRLLYCGEWIESHTLHITMLHAPDFLAVPDVVALARVHPQEVERALRLKRTGNDLVATIGGREIHPVNVRAGGFYRVPSRAELEPLAERLRRARDDALAMVRWVAGFPFDDAECDVEMLAVTQPDEYPLMGRRITSTRGLDFDVSAFEQHVEEVQVAHSTALHAGLRERGAYLVGALSRYTLASRLLSPLARAAAADAGLGETCRNPARSIVVRAVEVLHACDLAVRIIENYEPPDRPAVPVVPRAGTGYGCSEAPRGLLYHSYRVDNDGTILSARIVPPTSQNQRAIEADLRDVVERHLDLDDHDLAHRCEHAIRNHDPCISCATHFLDLTVERT